MHNLSGHSSSQINNVGSCFIEGAAQRKDTNCQEFRAKLCYEVDKTVPQRVHFLYQQSSYFFILRDSPKKSKLQIIKNIGRKTPKSDEPEVKVLENNDSLTIVVSRDLFDKIQFDEFEGVKREKMGVLIPYSKPCYFDIEN